MEKFIIAEVTDNRPGAEYQGNVYDRDLTLKPASGMTLRVFDGFDRLSTELKPGNEYEFVLCPFILKNLSIATEAEIKEERVWAGKIIDKAFRFEKGCCQTHIADFLLADWVLVSTSLGQIVLSPSEVKYFSPEAQPGDWIRWEFSRLDLCAVI